MSPILNSQKWVPHYGNTHFHWVDSPRNDIFKIRQKMNSHFEPFPVLGSIRNGQIWVLHYQNHYNTHWISSASTRNELFTLLKNKSVFFLKTAIFSNYLLCNWFEMVKFEFCIIINHVVPIFVDLVALEMIFIQFNEKRAAIFKIRHFEPLLAMGSIPNGQKWILHHQKP